MKIAQIFVERAPDVVRLIPTGNAGKRQPYLLTRIPIATPICPVIYYEPRPKGDYYIAGHRVYFAEIIGAKLSFVLIEDPPKWAEVLVRENERFQQAITNKGELALAFHNAAGGLDGEPLLQFMRHLGQPPKNALERFRRAMFIASRYPRWLKAGTINLEACARDCQAHGINLRADALRQFMTRELRLEPIKRARSI